jgi:hypothetical protein
MRTGVVQFVARIIWPCEPADRNDEGREGEGREGRPRRATPGPPPLAAVQGFGVLPARALRELFVAKLHAQLPQERALTCAAAVFGCRPRPSRSYRDGGTLRE